MKVTKTPYPIIVTKYFAQKGSVRIKALCVDHSSISIRYNNKIPINENHEAAVQQMVRELKIPQDEVDIVMQWSPLSSNNMIAVIIPKR